MVLAGRRGVRPAGGHLQEHRGVPADGGQDPAHPRLPRELHQRHAKAAGQTAQGSLKNTRLLCSAWLVSPHQRQKPRPRVVYLGKGILESVSVCLVPIGQTQSLMEDCSCLNQQWSEI